MADTVYAQQLSKLKHGLPLWVPEPTRRGRAVAIGDVGYVKRGAFYPLFNACLPAEKQSDMGVPDGFVPLVLGESDICVMDKFFDAGPLYTASVTKIEAGAEVSAALVQAEAGIHFQCSNKIGAVLVLKQPATRQDALPCKRLADYIRRYHTSWLEFANDRHQRGIEASDLILVSGHDVTSEWALAAFTEAQRGASIFFRGGYSALAGGGLSLAGTWDSVMSAQHRSGPPNMPSPRPSSILSTISAWKGGDVPIPVKQDQCVFMRGYKIRPRRLFAPKVLEAAAEPKDAEPDNDQPPPSPLSEGSEAEYEVESLAEAEITYDPLDYLLDYILESSSALCALASHDDLAKICKDIGLPDDLSSHLRSLSLDVIVDEDGVGYLSHGPIPDIAGRADTACNNQITITGSTQPQLNTPPNQEPHTHEVSDSPEPFLVRARHDFHASNPNQLSFDENDVIEVVDQPEAGWFDGLLGGERGSFPSNVVDIVLNVTEAATYSAEYAVAAASPPLPSSPELMEAKKGTPPTSPRAPATPKGGQVEASPRARTVSSESWWEGSKFYPNPQAKEQAERGLPQARTRTSSIFSRWTSLAPPMSSTEESERSAENTADAQ